MKLNRNGVVLYSVEVSYSFNFAEWGMFHTSATTTALWVMPIAIKLFLTLFHGCSPDLESSGL